MLAQWRHINMLNIHAFMSTAKPDPCISFDMSWHMRDYVFRMLSLEDASYDANIRTGVAWSQRPAKSSSSSKIAISLLMGLGVGVHESSLFLLVDLSIFLGVNSKGCPTFTFFSFLSSFSFFVLCFCFLTSCVKWPSSSEELLAI